MRMLEQERNGELIRETNDPLFMCNICCGYPDWWNDKRRLFANIKSIRIVNGKNTDLAIDKPVYDIEFELVKE